LIDEYSQWSISWPTADKIILVTKPNSEIGGYAYALRPTTGEKTKILGPVTGLELSQSSAGAIVFSAAGQGQISSLRIIKPGKPDLETTIKTLIKKCGWANKERLVCGVPRSQQSGSALDSWRKGELSFEDELWFVETGTGRATILYGEKQMPEKIDVQKIVTLEENVYVLEKNNLSVWFFKLATN